MLLVLVNIVVVVAFVVGGVLLAGRFRWYRLTRRRAVALRAALDTAPVRQAGADDLPGPVRGYLKRALGGETRLVRTVRMEHAGRFRLNESPRGWRAFGSDQQVSVFPPGMLWNARIRMNPALTARVHDALIGGMGLLHATLVGLVTVAHREDRADLASAELMRYLAEAVWYPTALLPESGVHWEAIDSSRARATLSTGPLAVSLVFDFDQDGLVTTVRSDARFRGMKGGEAQFLPWVGRFSSYGRWGGFLVPVEGTVSWVVDGEEIPYWQGRLQSLEFGYAV